MSTDKLDIIIFGASGFTGKYVVFEAVSVLENYRWGIAGRSRDKLERVLDEMGQKAKRSLKHTPIFLADINDEESLKEMAKNCRVLVNCCGPYRFYGEAVVKACIEVGTHHVDVSGEPQYMETMQLKYNKEAEERGVYVISACGFDSIPAEMGVIFIEKNFYGVVNSVESYMLTGKGVLAQSRERGAQKISRGGAGIHYGTWESAVYGLAHAHELPAIRSQLFPKRLPKFQPILKQRPIMFRSEVIDGVCLPFPGSDRSVVMRSQRYFYEKEGKRPIQMHAYVAFDSWVVAAAVAFVAIVFGLLSKFKIGRWLLLKYPRLFSLGFVSHDGPSEETMEKSRFAFIMKATGWPGNGSGAGTSGGDKTAEQQFTDPPSKSLMVKISGPNPGYGATCVALLCSAVTILSEADKMPSTGGVLPPGAAFAKTSIITQLEKYEHGMKFEIMPNK